MCRHLSMLLATLLISACGAPPAPPLDTPEAQHLKTITPLLEQLNQGGERVRLVDTFRFNDALVVERYELPNGLTIIYQGDTQAPVFSYQTWFRVGSRDEPLGKTGIAHLFEHLMFKETANTPEGVFDRTIEGFGGRVNAATWLDWTYFYQDVPAPYFEEVARLEADRMAHVTLNETQLEAERAVVLNERKERVDNDPSGLLSERLWKLAYTVHPYKQPTIGWQADIEHLSLDDCLGFYRTYYAPNNAVLVVVGDVDRRRLLETVIARYGDYRRQHVPKAPQIIEPPQREPRVEALKLPISAERLLLGYHAPACTDPLHPALEVLNEVLFEGDTARLQRALVTEGELASSVYGFVPAFADPGLYEIGVDLRPGRKAVEAEDIMLKVFAEVLAHGIDETELRRAKNKLETRFYRQLQGAAQRAQALGFWAVTANDPYHLFKIAERYTLVTEADVRKVARAVLRPGNRTTIYATPK